MSVRFATLRKALEERDWSTLTRLFDDWSEEQGCVAALEYASHHLDAWPLEERSVRTLEPVAYLPLVRHLQALRPLQVEWARLPSQTQLRMLTVHVARLPALLPLLKQCPNIEHLRLNGRVKEMKYLKKLRHLRSLHFEPGARTLKGVESLKRLESLVLRRGGRVRFIKSLSALKQLRHFSCEGMIFPSLGDLQPLETLEHLAILDNVHLEDVSLLRKMPNLRVLELRGAISLRSLAPLAHLRQLEVLDISGCKYLRSLAPLVNLGQLKVLRARKLKRLDSLAGIERLTALEELDLSYSRLGSIRRLRGLQGLRDLRLEKVGEAFCAETLLALTNLESLSIANHPHLEELPSFAPLNSLRHLDVSRTALRDLDFLREVPSLQTVVTERSQRSS